MPTQVGAHGSPFRPICSYYSFETSARSNVCGALAENAPVIAPTAYRYRVRYRTPEGKSRIKTFARKVDADRFATSTEHARTTGEFVDSRAGWESFADFANEWASAQE